MTDKNIKFGRDVGFDILIKIKYGPTYQTPDVRWRHENREKHIFYS